MEQQDPSFFRFLSEIGLGHSSSRALFGAAVGLVPVFFKLSPFYVKEAEGVYVAKEWSLFADPKTDPKYTTIFPWYLLPLVLSIALSLFL